MCAVSFRTHLRYTNFTLMLVLHCQTPAQTTLQVLRLYNKIFPSTYKKNNKKKMYTQTMFGQRQHCHT